MKKNLYIFILFLSTLATIKLIDFVYTKSHSFYNCRLSYTETSYYCSASHIFSLIVVFIGGVILLANIIYNISKIDQK